MRLLVLALALLAAAPAIAAPGFVKTPMCGAVQMPDGTWKCPERR